MPVISLAKNLTIWMLFVAAPKLGTNIFTDSDP